MLIVTLQSFFHKGKEQIGLFFENDPVLNIIAPKILKVRWSKTHSCWHLLRSRENYLLVITAINNSAKIDSAALKEYIEKRNKIIGIKAAAAEKPSLFISRYIDRQAFLGEGPDLNRFQTVLHRTVLFLFKMEHQSAKPLITNEDAKHKK